MRVLALDAGNTAFKMAVFNHGKIGEVYRSSSFSEHILQQFLQRHPADVSIWCSVRNNSEEIKIILGKQFKELRLDDKTAVPVDNQYATPETLGADRLAAVTGAQQMFPGENILIIGAGTTLTYDFIDAKKKYPGGSISPGLRMRFDALHRLTAKLPQIETEKAFDMPYGNNTRTAILSGVQNGILHEMSGFIGQYAAQYSGLKIVLTGGDASFFEGLLKKGIFAPFIYHEPNLVLIGLNTVYHYND